MLNEKVKCPKSPQSMMCNRFAGLSGIDGRCQYLRGTALLISYFVPLDLAADRFRERFHKFDYAGIFVRCGV